MSKLKKVGFLPILIIFITFISSNQWYSVQIGNEYTRWLVCFAIIVCILWNKSRYFLPANYKDYQIVGIYFAWMVIGVVRGCFVAENYYEWKQLIDGSMALSLPLCVYVFSIPYILQLTLRWWVKLALPAFGLFFLILSGDAYQYYLAPILLIGCFLPVIPKKWRIVVLSLLVIMAFIDFSARSQVIKAIIVLLVSIGYLMTKYFTITYIIKFVHRLCYIIPIILLVIGIMGIFNPFESLKEKNEGIYMQEDEDLAEDTRTFLYEEVISSAVYNQYVWQGRTPARGNDSEWFGAFNADELQTGKYERFENEACHLNVFTWLGLIGIILYSLIYLRSSFLAVYKSNNTLMKLLGVFIAFRWAYGWVEDFNRLDIMNISLWMMIAMGFSETFRQMNNEQFKKWIVGVFKSYE